MAKGSNKTEKISLGIFFKLSEQISQRDQADEEIVKRANRKLVWIIGGLMSALPWVVSFIITILYQESNPDFAALYSEFQVSFISGGSFLWLSITILAMALVELLLNGFREGQYQRTVSKHNWILVVVAIFTAIDFMLYFFNIGNPISECWFNFISVATFVLFVVLSWFILFKITK